MEPLVSIIIPTFNRYQLLGETLNSIILQNYLDWECLVVDDGSTDFTEKLVEYYSEKDDRIRYHSRPKNLPKGANSCRNYGLLKSKGVYINFFDSDDLMYCDKLEVQVKELISSGLNYTICQTELYDARQNKVLGLRAKRLRSENVLDDYIKKEIFWLTGAPLWKKSFLEENNLRFNPELFQSQDYEFHVRALAIDCDYVINEEVLVRMRIHESNMSNSLIDAEEKFFSNIQVRLFILKNFSHRLQTATIDFIHQELKSYLKLSILKFPIKIRLETWYKIYKSCRYTRVPPKAKIKFLIGGLVAVIKKDSKYITILK